MLYPLSAYIFKLARCAAAARSVSRAFTGVSCEVTRRSTEKFTATANAAETTSTMITSNLPVGVLSLLHACPKFRVPTSVWAVCPDLVTVG